MNQISNSSGVLGGVLKSNYDRAQSALGSPVTETLQVEDSILSLGDAVEFHVEVVRALLRRLHPVTGDLCDAQCSTSQPQPVKVPLAYRIDNWRDAIRELTNEVQNVVRALQI